MLAATGFLAMLLVAVGLVRNLSPADVLHLEVTEPSALGLKPGAPVWLAGIDIGRVETLEHGAGEDVVFRLAIPETHAPRLHTDAEVRFVGPPFAEGHLALVGGSPAAAPLGPGARLTLEVAGPLTKRRSGCTGPARGWRR